MPRLKNSTPKTSSPARAHTVSAPQGVACFSGSVLGIKADTYGCGEVASLSAIRIISAVIWFIISSSLTWISCSHGNLAT